MFADFQPVIRSIATGSHLSLFLVAGMLMIHGKMRAGDFMILGAGDGRDPEPPAAGRHRSTSSTRTRSCRPAGCTKC